MRIDQCLKGYVISKSNDTSSNVSTSACDNSTRNVYDSVADDTLYTIQVDNPNGGDIVIDKNPTSICEETVNASNEKNDVPTQDNIKSPFADVDSLKRDIDRLKEQTNEASVNYWRDKFNDMEKYAHSLEVDISVYRHDIDALNASLKDSEKTINELTSDLGAKVFEVKELNRQIDELKNKVDDVSGTAVYQMLQEIKKNVNESSKEIKTLLKDDEASAIMDYIIDLSEKYFSDIPFSEKQFRQFVYNIPRRVYYGMLDSIEKGEPDIINPMTLIYLMFVDEPAWSMGRFLKIIEKMMEDDADAINHFNDEYIKSLEEDEEETTEERVESEIIEEDDFNG